MPRLFIIKNQQVTLALLIKEGLPHAILSLLTSRLGETSQLDEAADSLRWA